MKRLIASLFCALFLLSSACGSLAAQPRTLRVMLYPFIPDANGDNFAQLVSDLENMFGQENPDIDLQITMDTVNTDVTNTYDTGVLDTVFGTGEGAYHVVEVDMLMLNYMVSHNYLVPIDLDTSDQFPAAVNAVTLNGQTWAIPTYLCTFFLFSYNEQVTAAENSAQLVEILRQLDPNNETTDVIGAFVGTNTMAVYYGSFYAGVQGINQGILQTPVDPTVVQEMAEVFGDCTVNGQNLCLGDAFLKSPLEPAQDFASGEALSFLAYSEELHTILTTNPAQQVYIAPAPLGDNPTPLLFTDALTISAATCDATCQQDAQTFASFYNRPDIKLMIAFAQDAPAGTPPRYIMPAQVEFWTQPEVASDPYYSLVLPADIYGVAFPTVGYVEERSDIYTEVCNGIDTILGEPYCPPRGA